MFSRRNMSSNVTYQEIKEYPCFKQLSKNIDVLILKQILPMVVKNVSLDVAKQSFNPKKMMYIPEENTQGVEAGHAIDATVKDIKENAKLRFFMIETKIYNILKHLFFKRIDCMEQLKNFEKLNFFYRSSLDEIPFGGYVYRKDEPIKSIFYLVRGQINILKCIDQKQISICTIYEGTFFGIYEFQKNKIKRILNTQSCSNDTIVLSISLDLITQLFGRDEDEVLKKIISLPSEISKIKLQDSKRFKWEKTQQNNSKFIKAYEFQRRLINFQQKRSINRNESAFGKFVDNKSLLFKIKDSNDSIPTTKEMTTKEKNVTTRVNFHKSQLSVKYYNRLNQHRLQNLGGRVSTQICAKQNIHSKYFQGSDLLSSRLKCKFQISKKHFQNKDSSSNKQSQFS